MFIWYLEENNVCGIILNFVQYNDIIDLKLGEYNWRQLVSIMLIYNNKFELKWRYLNCYKSFIKKYKELWWDEGQDSGRRGEKVIDSRK